MIPALAGVSLFPLQFVSIWNEHDGGRMSQTKTTPKWRIVAAWIVVLVPLGWGIASSLADSLKLLVSK